MNTAFEFIYPDGRIVIIYIDICYNIYVREIFIEEPKQLYIRANIILYFAQNTEEKYYASQ